MEIKIVLTILYIVLFISFLVWFLSRTSDEEYFTCKFYNVAVKGKISIIYPVMLNFFRLDIVSTLYYLEVTYSNVKYIHCNPEDDFIKQIGDSVIKEANSKIVKVKRAEKTFIIELPVKKCE